MNISLDEHWESFVAGLVGDGRYASSSEVVSDGLRLIEERERKLAALRAMLQESIDEGGEVTEQELDAVLDERCRELAREGL